MLSNHIKVQQCHRCELLFPARDYVYPHCAGLDTFEASRLKSDFKKRAAPLNNRLGKLFIILFVMLVNISLIYAIFI